MPTLLFIFSLSVVSCLHAAAPRARDLGIPFDGTAGRLNAITDVPGVEVGYTTLISGEGKLVPGKGPVRTGVTAIFARGKTSDESVPAAWFSLNGNGEMTGTAWIDESGFLEGPIVITNTHGVGTARDAVVEWGLKHFPGSDKFSLPVVAETWDGVLNDINGFHLTKKDVFAALDHASSGQISEGNVGGGTGMIAFRWKGGTGTASRVLRDLPGKPVLGVLVQANFGERRDLKIAGVPVGTELTGSLPVESGPSKDGSIITVVATEAPLLPHQLKRLVKRVTLGLGKSGSVGRNSSGDLFLAFSTATPKHLAHGIEQWNTLPNSALDPLFEATVEATEEAIVNTLVAAKTMTGINRTTVYALPHSELQAVLRKYHRLTSDFRR